jgi:hypothetical protein
MTVVGCQSAPETQPATGGSGSDLSQAGSGGADKTSKTSSNTGGKKTGGSSSGGSSVGGSKAGTSSSGGASNEGGTTSGSGNTGGTLSGGTSAGGVHTGGSGVGGSMNSGGTKATTTTQNVVTLSAQSVTATVVGIHGDDLALSIKGTQTVVGDLLAAQVTLLDASSNAITFFDTNQDGISDPGPGSLVFDAAPTATSFTGTGTIAKAGLLGSLSKVSVKLIDINGGTSNLVTANVTQQPILTEGASCDPKGITNRCANTTGCIGATPKCTTPIVPTIDKFAYLSTASGGYAIVSGTDMASPLASVFVEFLDGSGAPVGFDTTGSGSKDFSFTSSNGITNYSGVFLWKINPSSDFVAAVAQLKLTLTDQESKNSTPVTAVKAAIPVRNDGAACDTRGFDVCSTNSLCWPGTTANSGTCQTISSKQNASCTAATTLSLGNGTVRTAGRFSSVSLWTPPVECSTPSSLTAPDTVVHLKLTTNVSNLTISTKTPETNVATVVYVLDSCVGTPTADKCSDRPLVPPSADAELTLTDVPAGDYYVILENLDYRAGSYGLIVIAQ